MRPAKLRKAWRVASLRHAVQHPLRVAFVLPVAALLLLTPASIAQDPPKKAPPGKAKEATANPERSGRRGGPGGRRGRGRRGGRRAPMVAIKVGTIHPVSGPEIKNGVILVRGGRIMAIGTADKVTIPQGATIVDHPDGHAYPGLVDALSSAFVGSRDLTYGGTNAGSDFADALDMDHKPSHRVVEAGITTAYVSSRNGSTWRGLGVIIRPQAKGFQRFRNRLHGGVEMRMTASANSHALNRQKQLGGYAKTFDTLEAYEKRFKDHDKAMEEYKKKYKEYLDYFKKKKKGGSARGAGGRGAGRGGRGPGRGGRGRGGRRGRPGSQPTGGEKKGQQPPKKEPPKKETPKTGGNKKEPAKTAQDPKKAAGARPGAAGARRTAGRDPKAPKKPKYPKKPKKDPAKEALLKVKAGKLPLRIEAHRKDEIRAVIKMARDKELPQVTLEHATEAGEIAKEVVDAGMPVIVTELLPAGASGLGAERDGSLPAKLNAAGVPVAIASGSQQNARHLTLMAAWASGHGLSEDAAVRAITLTAAEILGVEEFVGSLERGKVADVLITSGPLLKSDTRVLRVMSRGQTQFEAAKEAK